MGVSRDGSSIMSGIADVLLGPLGSASVAGEH
jgi:hypothetical protein